jgi:hypothetical protein
VKRRDWERIIFRFFGACLGIIFAAYLTVGPRWICKSIDNISAQQPALTATWKDSRVLSVSWQAAEPVCIWLIGGNRLDTPRPIQCAASGVIELPTGGVSADYAPQLREAIELRNTNSQTVVRLAVPAREWRVILPIVAAN